MLIALYLGFEKLAELLIRTGINVNAQGEWKETPIHLAAYSGYEKIVELLIRNKANVSAEDEFKLTPLHHAISDGTNINRF